MPDFGFGLLQIRTRQDSSEVCAGDDTHLGLSSLTWNDVRIATSSDTSMNKLLELVEHGFPHAKNDLPQELRAYHQYIDKPLDLGLSLRIALSFSPSLK